MRVEKLYTQCLHKTAGLLKMAFWSSRCNPFTVFPRDVVHDLIFDAINFSPYQAVWSSDLELLLTSGRVKEFSFDIDFGMKFADADHIFKTLMNLSTACDDLEYFTFYLQIRDFGKSPDSFFEPAVSLLLRKARKLKHLETNIEFDLAALQNSSALETLNVVFSPRDTILNFLKVDGLLRSRKSLRFLSFHEISFFEKVANKATLLKYCPELTHISGDLSKTLQFLHIEELHKGTLTPQYKLKKLSLKLTKRHDHERLKNFDSKVAGNIIQIAKITCPALEDLNVILEEDETVPLLSTFTNLTVLEVYRGSLEPYGNFDQGLKTLLQDLEFGCQLKSLTIYRFYDVNLETIGCSCPNLKLLNLKGHLSNSGEIVPDSFRCLSEFNIWLKNEGYLKMDLIASVIRNAANCLEMLDIKFHTKRDDHKPLENVLSNVIFPKLRELHITNCEFSKQCVQNLLESSPNLEIVSVPTACHSFIYFCRETTNGRYSEGVHRYHPQT